MSPVSTITRGIEFDYGFAMGEPRQFKSKTPVLTRLGVDNYDQMKSKKISDIKFNDMNLVNQKFKKELKGADRGKIRLVVQQGIAKEVVSIINRQEAKQYEKRRSERT